MSLQVSSLRVAFVAGTLAQGGAEKQLVYMVAALQRAGADVKVYCCGSGEHFEGVLRDMGVAPVHIGRSTAPAVRLATLAIALRRFRPHVVQAAHFYMNLYAALAARACGALPVGAIRSDGVKDLGDTGAWGWWLLRMPSALIVNSRAAQAAAQRLGVPAEAVHLIANVLASPEGSAAESGRARQPQTDRVRVLAAGGLHQAKRFDRFIAAISAARARRPGVTATIAGAGPERKQLEAQAQSLGLLPDALRFAGHCPDMAGAFREADIFMVTSDHEGFPNVILEAMAAGLPVITTPAGDAGRVVVDGSSGYVVDFEDVAGLTDRILRLAASADLRTRLGRAGQLRVTTEYSPELLPERLLGAYRTAARRNRAAPLLASIEPPGARASEEAGCPA